MELISRDEAKRKIIEELDSIDHVPSWVYERLSTAIEFIPIIEERKEGKWIKHIDDLFPVDSTIECSICHEEQYTTIDDNFCPNCGARMKGE